MILILTFELQGTVTRLSERAKLYWNRVADEVVITKVADRQISERIFHIIEIVMDGGICQKHVYRDVYKSQNEEKYCETFHHLKVKNSSNPHVRASGREPMILLIITFTRPRRVCLRLIP